MTRPLLAEAVLYFRNGLVGPLITTTRCLPAVRQLAIAGQEHKQGDHHGGILTDGQRGALASIEARALDMLAVPFVNGRITPLDLVGTTGWLAGRPAVPDRSLAIRGRLQRGRPTA